MANPGWAVEHAGSFASARVVLPPHSSIFCETDAIVTMTEHINVQGFLSGGMIASIIRLFVTNESFFLTRVENSHAHRPGDCMLAARRPGDIVLHTIRYAGEELVIVKGAYLAADESIEIRSYVQSQIRNSILSGTGFVMLKASGRGTVACSAYGAIHKYTLGPRERRVVDTGHLVAWTAGMFFSTGFLKRGGFMSSLTSGEGLVCHFEGPGTIYVQSHIPPENPTNPRQRRSLDTFCAGVVLSAIVCTMLFLYLATNVSGSFRGKSTEWQERPASDYNGGRKPPRKSLPPSLQSFDDPSTAPSSPIRPGHRSRGSGDL